jgi:tRNA threonylcarbamoyladenosine biosynthesis protein TsaB
MATFDRVLILETSGTVGQAALASGTSIVAENRLGEGRRRASDLTLVTGQLLGAQGWKARDLTSVVIGLGPGSYTALRVGLASAKALAYATGCEFFGVETYAAIAFRLPPQARSASVIGDALQGKLFRRDYLRDLDGSWTPDGSLEVVFATDWLAKLRDGQWITGPATAAYEARLLDNATAASGYLRDPRPVELLAVAQQSPWAVTTDVWRAEPYYLRGSSAEEKAAGR